MQVMFRQISAKLVAVAAAAAVVFAAGSAMAAYGQPVDWQMTFQQSVTPVMDYITWFHDLLLWIISIITLFVLALLVIVIVKFNAKANPVPSKTTPNTFLEVAWTVVPVLILGLIVVPSFRLLFLQLNTSRVFSRSTMKWLCRSTRSYACRSSVPT